MWPFKYPYTNFHEVNLDWILEQVEKNSKNIASNTEEIYKIENTNFQPFVDNAVEKTIESGAFQAAIEEAMGAFITVKEFGAVGDGVTDDSNAINAALASGHKTIFIPDGQYRITRSILIPDDVKLIGFNRVASVFHPDGITGPVLLNDKYPAQANNITIKNISIIGQKNYDDVSNDGILINCAALMISDVMVSNVGGCGIKTGGDGNLVSSAQIIESTFANVICLGCGLSGFFFNGANDSTFIDCHFVSNGQSPNAASYGAANFYMNSAAKIIACHCWNYANASGFKRPPYGVIVNATGAKFIGCDIEGGAAANLYVSASAYKTIFSDCYFYAPGDTADSIIKELGHGSSYQNCYVWGNGAALINAIAANPVDRVDIVNVKIETDKKGIDLLGGVGNVLTGYYSGESAPYTISGATKNLIMMQGVFNDASFPHIMFPYEVQTGS